MLNLMPLFITATLYAGLAVYFWRGVWHPQQAGAASFAWEKPAILLPLALHAGILYQAVFQPDGLYLSVGQAFSAIAWMTVAVYWLASLRNDLEGLQGFVLPFAAISLAAPLLFPASHTLPHTGLPLFKIHFHIAILAYSLFTIAGLHALLMAFSEQQLHSRHLSRLLKRLPPLLTMEHILFRVLWTGFILLTLTLASGMLFSEDIFGQPLQFNHKTLFAIISWLIYATLLAGRHFQGWRSRTAIIWTLSGCASLFLAYIGNKFVLEVLLGH